MKKPIFSTPLSCQILTNQIVQEVFITERMNLQPKESFFIACSSIVMIYLAYESSQVYIDVGGPGTSYMPIHFSQHFGGLAAFFCNFSLNLYFLMLTLLLARNHYRQNKLYNHLNISVLNKKQLVQFTMAVLLATLSSTVMALIAGSTESVYNQIITGLVSIVLSYCGCITLLEGGSYLSKELRRFIGRSLSPLQPKQQSIAATKIKNNFFFANKREYVEYMEYIDNCLQQIPNHNAQWNRINNPLGYLNYLGKVYQKMLPLSLYSSTSVSLSKKKLMNTLSKFFLHLGMQIADKVSLYGYWRDTLQSTQQVFNLQGGAAISFALLIFTPFLMLSTKITYGTTASFIELSKTAIDSLLSFIKKPNCSENTVTTAFITILSVFFASFGYFLAFLSTNTTLELNAKHGLNTTWSVAASLLAVSAFNGFGFLEMTLLSAHLLKEHLLFSQKKRQILQKHRQVTSLFKEHPSSLTIQPGPTPVDLSLG